MQAYKRKLVRLEDSAALVRSGSTIYLGGSSAAPFALMRALASRADEIEDVSTYHLLVPGENPLNSVAMRRRFHHNVLFVGPADREAVNDGRSEYVPISLHRIPELFESRIPLDAAMVMVSPPDSHGFMSLGSEVLASRAACAKARRVIVQVNEEMPRTHGDTFLHVDQVDAIVEASEPLPELKAEAPGEVATQIARHIAGLIENGSTLQLGIGEIPDAVLKSITGARDLGIHTEMVSDGIIDAIESGAVTGAQKRIDKGKVVGTFAFGTRRLYDYLDDNPVFEFLPVEYTNDPFVIAQNPKVVAINSAIEVDLTGQVCAGSIGPYIYSGFGGQLDFIRGAARSRGGKPIIALPSTARNGTVSRIVPFLREGAEVVTTRADVHYVVTEFGVADLLGRNIKERARALIEIAHPSFRQQLETAAARQRRLSS